MHLRWGGTSVWRVNTVYLGFQNYFAGRFPCTFADVMFKVRCLCFFDWTDSVFITSSVRRNFLHPLQPNSRTSDRVANLWKDSEETATDSALFSCYPNATCKRICCCISTYPPRDTCEVLRWATCLSVYLFASVSQKPNFTKFSVHVTRGRGSVRDWQQCNTLCTSGFVDEDVMFSQRAKCSVFFVDDDENENFRWRK